MKKRHNEPKSTVDFGTTEDWINELTEIFNELDDTDGYLSSAELIEKTGKGKDSILAILRRFKAEGRLSMKQRNCINLAGRRQAIPVYKILK